MKTQDEIDCDDQDRFESWRGNNVEDIIEQYCLDVADNESYPEKIYEGVLDDDYEDAQNHYLESVTLEDIDEDFIERMYQSHLAGDDLE